MTVASKGMTVGKALRWFAERARREKFAPSLLGMVVNPFYIMRRGLWLNVSALATSIGGKVLDLGCGSKPYERLFVSAERYVGLDVEASGHDHAQSAVDVFYDGETFPFEDGSFDAVVSFETFEHIFNLETVLSEVRRVLVPDGKLLITIPFLWPEHEEPYDFGRYTSFGMTALLERQGFHVLSMIKSGTFVEALFQAFIAYFFIHLGPKKSILARALFNAVLVFPVTLAGRLASFILPRRYDCYCNLVVLAQKNASKQVPCTTVPVDPRRRQPV